ncbi:hypothetical protein L6164_018652 [Bauhinia variegata]|uniref:Uncharacterized protein n=1 Tax=Bauhinia variegata TaxID=167791 RepID=A0ACB9NBP6_BAUVA|nr:hypothetical protein L6164_018652 [Bauhinia variegata]
MCFDLGIPDIIHNHGKPIPLSQLISALSIHPSKTRCVNSLMRILIHSGFFSQQKVSENELEEGYVPTDAPTLLLKDYPLSVTTFLLAMLDPILTKPWHDWATWFQNENPTPVDTTHGMTSWEYAGNDPKLNHSFKDGMASDARLVTTLVIEKCEAVFKDLKSLVDVGGWHKDIDKGHCQSIPTSRMRCI